MFIFNIFFFACLPVGCVRPFCKLGNWRKKIDQRQKCSQLKASMDGQMLLTQIFFSWSSLVSCLHGRTCEWLRYVLPSIKNWWPFCSEYLQRQIMYQNDQSNFYLTLKKTMEMTWLHMVFGLFFYSCRRPSQISPSVKYIECKESVNFFHLLAEIWTHFLLPFSNKKFLVKIIIFIDMCSPCSLPLN